jgi:HD-GYP domain-containing protein (c-di-GMP phosphodiesterase class II)
MDKALVTKAADALELVDIHLYSSSIARFEEIFADEYPADMQQQNKLAVSAEVFETEDGKKLINVKAAFGMRFVLLADDKEEQALAEIESTFIAKYIQTDEIDEQALEEFIKFNAIHNVWPFWREHAFRMATEANLPKPLIPFFRAR